MPKGAIFNGLDFREILQPPYYLRLIIIKSIGHERQSAIKGAVVNVPVPVSNIVTSLPRAINQAEVIQLHLKRRMEYGHDFMAETIRPSKIAELELIKIRNNISTSLRKRSASSAITAANELDEDFMGNLISHDDGYRILKDIRTSSAHWEDEKQKVMAMIRHSFGR